MKKVTSTEVKKQGVAFCVDCHHFSFNHSNLVPDHCHYCNAGTKSLVPGPEFVGIYFDHINEGEP